MSTPSEVAVKIVWKALHLKTKNSSSDGGAFVLAFNKLHAREVPIQIQELANLSLSTTLLLHLFSMFKFRLDLCIQTNFHLVKGF